MQSEGHTDDSGNFMVLDGLIQDCLLLLMNIYLPPKPAEQINFFDKIASLIEQEMSQAEYKVILGGDISLQLLTLNFIVHGQGHP